MQTLKNKIISFVLSIILTIALIWGLFHFIEDKSIFSFFSKLYWPSFFLGIICLLGGFSLRTLRSYWFVGKENIRYHEMFLVVMVRQIFIDLLPMKMGELSYVLLLKKRFSIPVEIGMSSMMVTFLFDCISLFPVLFLSLVMVKGVGAEGVEGSFLWLSSILLILLVLVLWKLEALFHYFSVGFESVLKRSFLKKYQLVEKLSAKCHKITDELKLLKQRQIYLKTFFLTFGIRTFKYLSVYFVLFSLLKAQGFSLSELSFYFVVIALACSELTSFLPVQGLAGFGTWEAAWAGAFVWMGIGYDLAVLSGFGTHLLIQVTEYIFGGICLLLLYLPKKRGR